jgi:hypothetical protein
MKSSIRTKIDRKWVPLPELKSTKIKAAKRKYKRQNLSAAALAAAPLTQQAALRAKYGKQREGRTP